MRQPESLRFSQPFKRSLDRDIVAQIIKMARTVKSVKILVNIFLKDDLSPLNAAITILKHNANGSFELTCTLSLNLRVRSPFEFSYCCSYIFYRSSRERI